MSKDKQPVSLTFEKAKKYCKGCDNKQDEKDKGIIDLETICMYGHTPSPNCKFFFPEKS